MTSAPFPVVAALLLVATSSGVVEAVGNAATTKKDPRFARGIELVQNAGGSRSENEAGLEMLLEAWSDLKKSSVDHPDEDAEALFWTGWALRRRGSSMESARLDAVEFMGRAVSLDPKNSAARFYYGDAMVDAGFVEGGSKEMRRAVEEQPEAFDAGAMVKVERAEALAELRVTRDKVDAIEDAASSPSFARVWDRTLTTLDDELENVIAETFAVVDYLATSRTTSLWYSFDSEPVTEIEKAIVRSLRPLGVIDAVGVEYWARHQHADKGVVAHYDLDVSAARLGRRRTPVASSIVFLSDDGGPTFMLQDNSTAFVFPKQNRFAIFDGGLLHGVLPASVVDDDGVCSRSDVGPRIALLVNWWRDQPPLIPQCTPLSPSVRDYWSRLADDRRRLRQQTERSEALSPPEEILPDRDEARRRCSSRLSHEDQTSFRRRVPCPEDGNHAPNFFASS